MGRISAIDKMRMQTLCVSTWLPAWLPAAVTSSICCNSVHLQVCILISAPKKRLFSEPPTFYQRKQRSKCWKLKIIIPRVVQQHYVGELNPATKETQYNELKILLNHPSDHESSIKHKYYMQLHSPGNSTDRQNHQKIKKFPSQFGR